MCYRINAWDDGPCQRLLAWFHPVLLVLLVVLLGPRAAQAQAETLGEAWRWVRYTTASGLPSNEVLRVEETTTGTVWAVTDAGLAWYDGFRWRGVGAAEGLPEESQSYRVIPDAQGGLLVITDGHRLYQGNEQGFMLHSFEHEGQSLQVGSVAPLDEEGLLFMSTDGLYSYRSGVVERFPYPAVLDQAEESAEGGLVRTRNGVIWINGPLGLYRWDGDRWIQHFETYGHFLHEDPSGGIMVAKAKPLSVGLWTWELGQPMQRLEEGRGEIVALDVNSRGDAIALYSDGQVKLRRAGHWQWLTSALDLVINVYFLRFQQNGDLWVGSAAGLYLHRGSSRRWTRWSDVGNQVNAILRTRTGDLWIGSNEGVHIRRTDGTDERISAIDGTPLLAVTGLAEDTEGGIWVSSGSGFTGAFRRHEGLWRRVGRAQGLQATHVHRIAKDRQGHLWFLGNSGIYGGTKDDPEPGAFVYEGGRFTRWGPEEGLLHGRVYAFAEGPGGARWFGTLMGLSRWKDGQWTHWTRIEGLHSPPVFTLAVAPDGRVWFGHQNSKGGLGYLDEGDRPQYLTTDEGLVDNRVWDLQFGPDDALWITTQGGLSRYRDSSFGSFDRSAGLIYQGWPVLPLQDRVYVGSVGGGLYALNLEEADNPPPVIDIAVPVVDVEDVFRWQAFAFRGEEAPEHVRTRYRLDERPWSAWSTEREHVARNVASGGHTFSVQAQSLFGNVAAEGTSVAFRITAPWYQQPLFLAVLALWLVSMAGLGVSYWRRQLQLLAQIEVRNVEVQAKNVALEIRDAEREEFTQKLAAQNAQLERFTYTVSHDLKSPLVTIKGFLGLLEQDAARGETERMKRDMEQIASATDTMTRLLNELLELSRIGRQMNAPEAVSLTSLAREAASMVAGQIVARGVTVEIDPEMPTVNGDRVRLLEVYQNLIDNAVTFMGDQPQPHIKISVRQNGVEVVCYVRDNGIGIAPKYHEKIFGLFERLDGQTEGTGIGLALVKRIVEVHGGRIWVESEGVGRGSTFYFTLPGNASEG